MRIKPVSQVFDLPRPLRVKRGTTALPVHTTWYEVERHLSEPAGSWLMCVLLITLVAAASVIIGFYG